MQVVLYLLDEATTAAIVESLRCAVNRLALQGDRPWGTAAGASVAEALSLAPPGAAGSSFGMLP
jgi:hypothetical protein